MKSKLFLMVLGLLLILFSYSSAQVPQMINYQGKLTNTSGAPVNDTVQMVFSIYADEGGVTLLWTETQTAVIVEKGVFNVLLGSVNPIPDSVFNGSVRYLGVKVESDPEITPRKPMVSVPYAYRASSGGGGSDNKWKFRITDTADTSITTSGNWGIARYGATLYGDMDSTHVNLGVSCTTGISTHSNKYCTVAGGLANTASESATTVGGGYRNTASGFIATVAGGDSNTASAIFAAVGGGHNNLASGFAATVPGGALDTAAGDFSVALGQQVIVSPDADFTFAFGSNFITDASHAVIFKDTQIPIKVGIGTSEPTERLDVDGTVKMTGLKMLTGSNNGYVLTSDASGVGTWQPTVAGDNDWAFRITDTADTTLITGGAWGIARYGNVLFGSADSTHVNLGVACTTGRDGSSFKYCTVGGGYSNTASDEYATIGGGYSNTASDDLATVGGGERNTASDQYATVGGGEGNDASNGWTTVGGGHYNTASGNDATVGGGDGNEASGNDATVGGGEDNTASGRAATVCGGRDNTASGDDATVGGGYGNTSAGPYSFTTGNSSAVSASYNNSAAFNGQTATASGQTRVGVLSKASGSFTIDHPLDPDNKILNHYFIESPEMINIYRGVAHLDANGKAEIHLPDYFDALNRNTMVQLTGVGTSDVFVTEEVSGNRFVIGGKPGTKVYWMVTGDRKDPSAEITRIIMPVEQPKTDALVGRSLDDAFLLSTMQQLERMGEAGKFSFRTTAGRQRYEDMKRTLEEKKPGR